MRRGLSDHLSQRVPPSEAKATAWQTLENWFLYRGWQLANFQREAAEHFLQGDSGLIHAPTGSGKTLAAFAGPVLQGISDERDDTPPLQVLWITPLRALAQDTFENLSGPLQQLLPNWTAMLRTGDTSSTQRARMRKRLPSLLVTTPESLSLLLSYQDTQRQLGSVKAVVVDEWHELLGSKRGVLLQLSLARLKSLAPMMRLWGLSATLGNLDQAAQALLGNHSGPGRMVHAPLPKTVRVRTLRPDSLQRFPWAGHLGLVQLPQVIQAIEQADSTLLFTNTRSQAELWYEAIVKKRLDWLTEVAIHHGSLDRDVRRKVEDGLRQGMLKCVVCTSSLDLGVDFSPVDQVIQVGSAKGVARLAQRAGRSGHRPGETSTVLCVPTHAFELMEAAAARKALLARHIEDRLTPEYCLDVLCQHLVTLSLAGGMQPDDAYREAISTYAFRDLALEAWQWCLDFISRGGSALQHYPEFQRVLPGPEGWKVASRRIAHRHRMAIGTITSDASIQVKFQSGGYLGTIEESFISKLTPGDAFLFNGRVLELVRVKDMTAQVKLNPKARRIVPRWAGSRMPLSTALAQAVLQEFKQVEAHLHHQSAGESAPKDTALSTLEPEIELLLPLLELQDRWSALPAAGTLLVEQVKTREGYACYFYPFAGRLAHEGIAALLGYRLARRHPITFTMTVNDYGIELLSKTPFVVSPEELPALLQPENLMDDLLASINESEFAKRQFRDIARVAGLIFSGFPGAPKSTRNLQMSSGVLYEVLKQYDVENLLLDQALNEVLNEQMEYKRLAMAMADMREASPRMTFPERLTPLSFPLWADRLRAQVVSTEKWQNRLQRMADSLEKAANKAKRKKR